LRRWRALIALVSLTLVLTASSLAQWSAAYPGVYVPPPKGLPWYPIAVFGDNRPEDVSSTKFPTVYYQLLREVRAADPFALIGTGDHTGSGRLDQIIAFLDSVTGIENVLVIEGNHDVGKDHGYWLEWVSPIMYFWDGVPGWRFVFFSTEITSTEYSHLSSFLDKALNTTRNVVLVYHRPAYPDVNYNMEAGMKSMLIKKLEKYGNVKIALQGHWHGFAEELVNGVLFVITGGAGAPLYQSGGRNHYLYLLLKPSGEYEIIPVALGPGSGEISVAEGDDGTLIRNSKISINGSPIEIPVRIKLPIKGVDAYAVVLAPSGTTLLRTVIAGDKLIIRTNASTKWYIYYETPNGVILNSSDGGNELSLPIPASTGYNTVTVTTYELLQETVTITLPRTTTKTESTTITETIVTTATKTVPLTITRTSTVTTTQTSIETTTSEGPPTTNVAIAVVAGIIGGLITYSFTRRKQT